MEGLFEAYMKVLLAEADSERNDLMASAIDKIADVVLMAIEV